MKYSSIPRYIINTIMFVAVVALLLLIGYSIISTAWEYIKVSIFICVFLPFIALWTTWQLDDERDVRVCRIIYASISVLLSLLITVKAHSIIESMFEVSYDENPDHWGFNFILIIYLWCFTAPSIVYVLQLWREDNINKKFTDGLREIFPLHQTRKRVKRVEAKKPITMQKMDVTNSLIPTTPIASAPEKLSKVQFLYALARAAKKIKAEGRPKK